MFIDGTVNYQFLSEVPSGSSEMTIVRSSIGDYDYHTPPKFIEWGDSSRLGRQILILVSRYIFSDEPGISHCEVSNSFMDYEAAFYTPRVGEDESLRQLFQKNKI